MHNSVPVCLYNIHDVNVNYTRDLSIRICHCMITFLYLGTPVSGPLLMTKASQMFPQVYPESDPSSFKAGTGWLKRFRDRHGVRSLMVQGESLSAATDTVDPFKEKLAEIIEEYVLCSLSAVLCLPLGYVLGKALTTTQET